MRIAVIDDERLIRKDLIYYLKELAPEAEIEEADSGFSAVELANSKSFDIFFLDINLGDMKGTVLALMLQKTAPTAAVVFVTAYGEYGPQVFELNAADYIMKPFNKERVEKALKKALQLRRLSQVDAASEAGLDAASAPAGGQGPGTAWGGTPLAAGPGYARSVGTAGGILAGGPTAGAGTGSQAMPDTGRVSIHHDRKVTLMDPGDIVYVESTQRSCRVCCRDGMQFVTTATLTDLEKRLGAVSTCFMRIHKSFIINLDLVSEIAMLYAKNYCVKMKGYEKTPLPVGRNQIRKLKEKFQI